MKKLLVLMLVLGMASLASGALLLIQGIVEWDVVGTQLIGRGTATGTFNGFLSQGLIAPNPTTDSGTAGLMNAAGNLA